MTAPTGTTGTGVGAAGEKVFTKSLADAPPLFFDREAVGLRTLRAAGARVPEVLAVSDTSIVLAWVEQGGHRTIASEERFGRELAQLHASSAQEAEAGPGLPYGAVDGEPTAYLGACPIDLTPTRTWHESWVERRLVPLARRARDEGQLDAETAALAEQVDTDRLGPPEPPTLVHGDLWGGNRLVDGRGLSWLVDPCVHRGHREVDLAMMQLFGGFSGRALAAYVEAHPLAPGWQERVAVYQTVPLLVHALLFGGAYVVQAGDALRAAAA